MPRLGIIAFQHFHLCRRVSFHAIQKFFLFIYVCYKMPYHEFNNVAFCLLLFAFFHHSQPVKIACLSAVYLWFSTRLYIYGRSTSKKREVKKEIKRIWIDVFTFFLSFHTLTLSAIKSNSCNNIIYGRLWLEWIKRSWYLFTWVYDSLQFTRQNENHTKSFSNGKSSIISKILSNWKTRYSIQFTTK